MDTSDQQAFPWIPIRYIRGSSDQIEVNQKSDLCHSLVRLKRVQGRDLL
jgi:hypothetical protein